jgi:hypothetical protein
MAVRVAGEFRAVRVSGATTKQERVAAGIVFKPYAGIDSAAVESLGVTGRVTAAVMFRPGGNVPRR